MSQIPSFGAALDSSRAMWYGSANCSGYAWNNARTWSVKVTCNTHAQFTTCYGLANHNGNDKKDGSTQYSMFLRPFFSSGFWCHENIWNNYVDIQQKIMQVRFIIFLSNCGYNSLGVPTRQHEVWWKILLNTNSWYLTEAFESMHTLFLLTKSAVHIFHWY